MKYNHPDSSHVFASSASTWMTTNPGRDTAQLIKLMQDEGRTFNLYFVPLPHHADYEIKMYRPAVEGAQWMGCYEPKGESK